LSRVTFATLRSIDIIGKDWSVQVQVTSEKIFRSINFIFKWIFDITCALKIYSIGSPNVKTVTYHTRNKLQKPFHLYSIKCCVFLPEKIFCFKDSRKPIILNFWEKGISIVHLPNLSWKGNRLYFIKSNKHIKYYLSFKTKNSFKVY
jgi:hypothetical protein